MINRGRFGLSLALLVSGLVAGSLMISRGAWAAEAGAIIGLAGREAIEAAGARRGRRGSRMPSDESGGRAGGSTLELGAGGSRLGVGAPGGGGTVTGGSSEG